MKHLKHSQRSFCPETIECAALTAPVKKNEMKHAFGCLHYIRKNGTVFRPQLTVHGNTL